MNTRWYKREKKRIKYSKNDVKMYISYVYWKKSKQRLLGLDNTYFRKVRNSISQPKSLRLQYFLNLKTMMNRCNWKTIPCKTRSILLKVNQNRARCLFTRKILCAVKESTLFYRTTEKKSHLSDFRTNLNRTFFFFFR